MFQYLIRKYTARSYNEGFLEGLLHYSNAIKKGWSKEDIDEYISYLKRFS